MAERAGALGSGLWPLALRLAEARLVIERATLQRVRSELEEAREEPRPWPTGSAPSPIAFGWNDSSPGGICTRWGPVP